MKKRILSGMLIIGTVCLTASAVKTNAQSTKETNAIKKTIQQETSAYFHKNYEGWTKTWAHDSADFILRAGPGGYSQMTGWDTIAAQYKKEMKNMAVMSDAEIAPHLHNTDFHIYINGNTATATFREGNKTPEPETRTLIKQNGEWKILNLSSLNSESYAMQNTINNMKAFSGKWALDGKATMDPPGKRVLKAVKVDLKATPNGLEQLSNIAFTYKNQLYDPPAEQEYFIPDYGTNTISYLDIQKDASGHTYTQTGKVTSDHPNSYTVTVMYPDKPAAVESEYTVTMQNGQWHQTGKVFDKTGKVTHTMSGNLHRVQ